MNRNLPEHILQTASDLFYRHGIQATGIDAIVKASGVAKMSLYKYFPSKEDLVLAYLQRSSDMMQAKISTGLASKPCTNKQKLIRVFEIFADDLSAAGFRGCPFINATAEFAEQAGPVQQAAANFYDYFVSFLTALAKQAEIKNPEQLAQQLAILLAGAIVREQMQANSGAIEQATLAAEVLIMASSTVD